MSTGITTWLLIHQQLSEAVPAQLPKQIVKTYARNRRPAPDVRIVRIRPRSTSRPPKVRKPATTSKRATPDHRYWVSGHDRQQPYGPGRKQTRTVTIQPFLKVDPSLPIKLTEIDRTVTVNDALRGITAAQTGSRQGGELEDRTAYGRFPSGSDIWVSMIASVGSIARP